MDSIEADLHLAALPDRLAAQARDLHRLFMHAFVDMLSGKTRSFRDVGRALKAQNQCRIALRLLVKLRAAEEVQKKFQNRTNELVGNEKRHHSQDLGQALSESLLCPDQARTQELAAPERSEGRSEDVTSRDRVRRKVNRYQQRRSAMDLQWRNFSCAITVAAALATPALGQNGRAPSPPDFSGIWAHANPGFEPLSSGPTSLINRERRENGTGNGLKLVGDHTNPILKPEAAEMVKKHGELGLNWMGDPNPHNQCWPEGPPFALTNGPTQIVQAPNKVTILYQDNSQVRHIRLNQPHPARVTPSWYGDSVGHYEGDTLVVDTVGIKVGKYAMVDWYGTPHSEALHVVERYRMIDYAAAKEGFDRDAKEHNVDAGMPVANPQGKYLQLHFTVEDPKYFTTKWSATMTYRYANTGEVGDWAEQACAENLFWYPGVESDVPRALKPDF